MRHGKTLRRYTLLICLAAASSLLGGCQSLSRTPGTWVGPLEFEPLKRGEYEILESVEGVGTVTTIFGFAFASGAQGYVSAFDAPGLLSTGQPAALSKAVYNATSKVRDADIMLPLRSDISVTGIPFFLQTVRATVWGKAIRIKSDDELSP